MCASSWGDPVWLAGGPRTNQLYWKDKVAAWTVKHKMMAVSRVSRRKWAEGRGVRKKMKGPALKKTQTSFNNLNFKSSLSNVIRQWQCTSQKKCYRSTNMTNMNAFETRWNLEHANRLKLLWLVLRRSKFQAFVFRSNVCSSNQTKWQVNQQTISLTNLTDDLVNMRIHKKWYMYW